MKFRRRIKAKTGIDLTAMIDVVFNLLIFFMVGTTMINNPLIRVNLPKSSSQERSEREGISITITEEGKYYLNRDSVSSSELNARLNKLAAERDKEEPVIIRPDKHIPVERLVDAMNMANAAGFIKVSIATEE